MHTYTLYQLIMFFKFQQRTDFKIINKILHTIDSDLLEEDQKKDVILFKLRDSGLVDREHEAFLNDIKIIEFEKEIEKRSLKNSDQYDGADIPLQIFNIKIINQPLKFTVVLN